jgi:ubiquinone/menaquinone biosynthesis C-methylase UbiE
MSYYTVFQKFYRDAGKKMCKDCEDFIEPGSKILDLGCGAGRTTIPLFQMGYQVFGIDLVPKMIIMAKQNAQKENLRIQFQVGDATKLKFPVNSFDSVLFSFNGIENIPRFKNRLRAFSQIYRVLKPKGIFIFCTYNIFFYFLKNKKRWRWFKKFLTFYFKKIFGFKQKELDFGDFYMSDQKYPYKKNLFLHFSNPLQVQRALKKVGFKLLLRQSHKRILQKLKPSIKDLWYWRQFYVCQKESA